MLSCPEFKFILKLQFLRFESFAHNGICLKKKKKKDVPQGSLKQNNNKKHLTLILRLECIVNDNNK